MEKGGHEVGPFDAALVVLVEEMVVLLTRDMEQEGLLEIVVAESVIHVEHAEGLHGC